MVTVAEADTMRLVAARTRIPVPQVYHAYEEHGRGYIWMSKIEGRPLSSVWSSLSQEEVNSITEQLTIYISELRDIKGDYIGRVGDRPCSDVFFSHFPRFGEEVSYGPYTSRTAYNSGLVQALEKSRPMGNLSDSDLELVRLLKRHQCEEVVFTHGDLHMGNILINDSLNIFGLLDWGESGYSIVEREAFEARSRARDPRWIDAVNKFIPPISEEQYHNLLELEQQLVVYSGF